MATVREALGFSDIPPAAHELATILQFGTSYELVEWLARRLHEGQNGTQAPGSDSDPKVVMWSYRTGRTRRSGSNRPTAPCEK